MSQTTARCAATTEILRPAHLIDEFEAVNKREQANIQIF